MRSVEHAWILRFRGVLERETRLYVAMGVFSTVGEHHMAQQEMEMLINREELLTESFNYVRDAMCGHPRGVRERVSIGTLGAEGVVLPGSYINSLHLEYFHFCGQMIALALMYKVQVLESMSADQRKGFCSFGLP
ncbi:E3 ubiquitin-protein ligase UPL5 [Acorus calamus]|uniref:E3 ubiquitin-protein ligase UPL5 n=1 Tax=Acorus calamus TaxID=4465 RepID=A0AAV9CWB4_ACOCL|nr:E3 ubiquitin-protein ligase UPL5 [Acorus calamus]